MNALNQPWVDPLPVTSLMLMGSRVCMYVLMCVLTCSHICVYEGAHVCGS